MRKKKPFLSNDSEFVKEFDQTIRAVKKNDLYLTHYFDPYDVIENGKLEAMLGFLVDIKVVTYDRGRFIVSE